MPSLFNPHDDDWIVMVGRYMLNMGVVEFATRILIDRIEGTDKSPVFQCDLRSRIGFLRNRFPHGDSARHKWAMNVFNVAKKHTDFRNIVAHSPLAIERRPDGSYKIFGLMDVTPKSTTTIAQIVSLQELRGRVNESATVASDLLGMEHDYPVAPRR